MNKIFYFTSTGNSLFAAREIQKRIGGELISIPQAIKEGRLKYKGDKIGIVYPCYALYAPKIVREFIESIEIEGRYVFSVMTYGNISLGGVEVFSELCEKNGISLDYVNEVLMVDNYLPMYDIEKQLKKQSKKNIDANLEGIVEDIHSESKFIKSKGMIGRFASSRVYKLVESGFHKTPEKFLVEKSCTSCGVCEKVCPVGNIKVGEKEVVFSERCIGCLGCTNNCPVNSIRMTNEKSRMRFRNENTSLKDIIDSNWRKDEV